MIADTQTNTKKIMKTVVCRELSDPRVLISSCRATQQRVSPFTISLTDIGNVLCSLGFDTDAALITFLVHCQANNVNPQIWVSPAQL